MIIANSLRMTALSSSGFERTRIRQATSNSCKSSIPVSLIPSKKPAGLISSKTVRSGKSSGTEYLVKIYLTFLPFSFIRSANFMKIASAISSICSSSMVRLPRETALFPALRLMMSERGELLPPFIIIFLISESEPSDPSELLALNFELYKSNSLPARVSFRSVINSLKLT